MQRKSEPKHHLFVERAAVKPESLAPVTSANLTRETLDTTFANNRDRLLGICRSLIGDDAEDVVQDVYIAARARLGQVRDRDRLEAWLTRIAVNECFRRHRRRQTLTKLLPFLKPRDVLPRDPDLTQLIESLPHRERTIVVLHYGHGLELEEVAGLLSLNPATVRSILFRTRQRLRSALEPTRNLP